MNLKFNISGLLYISPLFLFAQPLQLDWAVEYPCFAPSSLEYDKVVTDADQNVYLCGAVISPTNPLNGAAILTQQYDSTGSLIWESKFDGLHGNSFKDCEFLSSEGYLVGGSRGCLPGSVPCRAELVNYDMTSGGEIWHTYIFDTIQEAATLQDIDLDDDSNIYAFGQYSKYLTEYDSNKMFLAKISQETGETLWKHVYQNEFEANQGKVLEDRIRIYGGKFLGTNNYTTFLMDIDFNGNQIASVNIPNISFGPGIFNPYFFFDNQGFLIGFGYKVIKFDLTEDPIVWAFDFARGLPNMKGQALTATTDDDGNVYATGYLRDTLTLAEYTQTIKLSPDGELLWATVDKFSNETTLERGYTIAVSNQHVFVCSELWYYQSNSPEKVDYRPILYSNEDGSILYDTLIDANVFDITYNAHYGQGHFYLLGRSYYPSSSDPDDYRYKLFKFSVGKPSGTTDKHMEAHSVSLFPNPTSSSLTISELDGKHFDQFYLYDGQGRQVFFRKLDKAEQPLRLPKLAAGVYLVKLTGKDAVFMDKLVIQP